MRADAERNREKVLRAAATAFAAEGTSVPVQEIARRAGVGTGTVGRHFPTKEALYRAVVLNRLERLVGTAEDYSAEREPADALFSFVAFMAGEWALDHGLAEALAADGFDIAATADEAGHDVHGALGALLAAAQRSGDVRADVDASDVKALVMSCASRPDETARARMVDVVRAGLRP